MSNGFIAILLGADNSDILKDEIPENLKQGVTFWDNALQMIGLLVLLIVILVATYYTSRLVGGMKLGQMKNSNFKIIDVYRISPNKALQLVKIGNKYIVISIGKDTVNFITEVDEAEILNKEMQGNEIQSFKQILDKLRNNKK
jgi:flagellar protein FliO/FliZ